MAMIRRAGALFCLLLLFGHTARADSPEGSDPGELSDWEIGYSHLRTNLPGGRHANVSTTRAQRVVADGKTTSQAVAPELATAPDTWTQFAGWSPDGRYAIVAQGWEDPANARWEEEHQTFRMTEGWRLDSFLVDVETGQAENLTAVERVSNYNAGLYFWPQDPQSFGFEALIDGKSHPFRMDRDGRNKRDLAAKANQFIYGSHASPDGTRLASHRDYQIHVADAQGENAQHINTGRPFNFCPRWSPDGKWLLFVSGEHYDCHPWIVQPDGSQLRQLADRNGYRGVVEFLDVPDFHGGSSDVPVWHPGGKWVYYTAQSSDGDSSVTPSIDLYRVNLEGVAERLVDAPPGRRCYHPLPSPDGQWLLFGTDMDGARAFQLIPAAGGVPRSVTESRPGEATMWAHWRPRGPQNAVPDERRK